MPSPNNTTNITPPRVPLIDERSGLISREWYRFFLNLFTLTGSGRNTASLTDLQLGPPVFQQENITDINTEIEAGKLQPSQNATLADVAELSKQVEALAVLPLTSWVLSQIAELQAQIDGLLAMSTPPVNFLTSGSSILYGDNLGGFSNVAIGSGLSFSGGTLSATGGGGGVTAVTGIAPITSTGGATPAIGVTAAALTKTDDTNVTLTLGGSPSTALLAATSLTLGWTGQLATTRGGTGLSSFTANGVAYAASASTLATGSALTFDGTNFATTGSATATAFIPSGSTVPTNGMYLPSANTVSWATASTQRMTLSAAGGLSIGSTTDAGAGNLLVNGYVVVGGAPDSSTGLKVVSTAMTGASQAGFYSDPTFNSSATGTSAAVWARGKTAASAFTASAVHGVRVLDATKGAGSTITDQYGLSIVDQTQGTNNYGIASAVSSGTNKYNIYASGTAQNYFAGNTGIGTSSPGYRLDVYSGTASSAVAQFTGVNNNRGLKLSTFLSINNDAGVDLNAQDSLYGTLTFSTRSVERMRIDLNGAIGIAGANFGTSGQVLTSSGSGASPTWSRVKPRTAPNVSTGTLTPNIDNYDLYLATGLTGALTIAAPTGSPVDGDKITFRILDNGTSRTLTWNATYTVIGVTLPTATTANKMIYVGCVYNTALTRWDVIAVTTQA